MSDNFGEELDLRLYKLSLIPPYVVREYFLLADLLALRTDINERLHASCGASVGYS